jgi:hypothetical protein
MSRGRRRGIFRSASHATGQTSIFNLQALVTPGFRQVNALFCTIGEGLSAGSRYPTVAKPSSAVPVKIPDSMGPDVRQSCLAQKSMNVEAFGHRTGEFVDDQANLPMRRRTCPRDRLNR